MWIHIIKGQSSFYFLSIMFTCPVILIVLIFICIYLYRTYTCTHTLNIYIYISFECSFVFLIVSYLLLRWSMEFGSGRSGCPELHDMFAEYIYSESPELVCLLLLPFAADPFHYPIHNFPFRVQCLDVEKLFFCSHR